MKHLYKDGGDLWRPSAAVLDSRPESVSSTASCAACSAAAACAACSSAASRAADVAALSSASLCCRVDAGIPGFARPEGANLSSGSREPKDRQNPLRERTAVRRRRSILSHCGSLRQSAPFVCQSPRVLRTEHIWEAKMCSICRLAPRACWLSCCQRMQTQTQTQMAAHSDTHTRTM